MKSYKKIAIISILYTISYGLMLFNKGVYWDDWVWYKIDIPLLYDAMSQIGAPWLANYFDLIFSFQNVQIFRVITFFAYWGAVVFLYFILQTIDEINEENRTFICIFFAIFPCNTSRMMICLSQYAISYFLFFCGFFLVSKYMKNKLLFLRLVSLCIFFISFTTNSFLVFYSIVLIYIAYLEKKSEKKIVILVKEYFDFIALPILYWIAKKLFLTPYGTYVGYNSLEIKNILLSPITAMGVFLKSYILGLSVPLFTPFPIFIIIVLGVFTYMVLLKILKNELNSSNDRLWLIIGLIIFYLSVFPYLAVGAFPRYNFFDSRHQLLLPLSMSIILVYSTSLLINKIGDKANTKRKIFAFICALFVAYNSMMCLDFQKDWYKQMSLIDNMKENIVISNNSTFLFKDETMDLNVLSREYRYYEFNGMMKQALGNEKRLGYDVDTGLRIKAGKEKLAWLTKDYQASKEIVITIKEGNLKLSPSTVLGLLYNEYFHPEKFTKDIHNIIALTGG